jgi:hypothetical protein
MRHVCVLSVHVGSVSRSTFDAGEHDPCHQRQADQEDARYQEHRPDDRMSMIHDGTTAGKKYEGARKIHGSASIRFMHALSILRDALRRFLLPEP